MEDQNLILTILHEVARLTRVSVRRIVDSGLQVTRPGSRKIRLTRQEGRIANLANHSPACLRSRLA